MPDISKDPGIDEQRQNNSDIQRCLQKTTRNDIPIISNIPIR